MTIFLASMKPVERLPLEPKRRGGSWNRLSLATRGAPDFRCPTAPSRTMPTDMPPPVDPTPSEPVYDPDPGATPYPEIAPDPSPAETPPSPATPDDGRPYASGPLDEDGGTQAAATG
jgi:hypothetical protein